MARRYGHAVLGGTFDRFHAGHEALLSTALRAGRRVSLGLTTDRYLARHPKPGGKAIQSFATRRRGIRSFVIRRFPGRTVRIVPLDDGVGGAAAEGVDALVVTPETVAGGRLVNRRRRTLGRKAVPLVIAPVVLADDLLPVSSRRIRAGILDRSGHRRTPLSIGIAVDDPAVRPTVERTVRESFPRVRLRFLAQRASSAGSARSRSRGLARKAVRGRDLGIGIGRDRGGGWTVVARSPLLELDPRSVPGRRTGALRTALAALLRPAPRKPLR